jgi:putative ABC transport system permease protein
MDDRQVKHTINRQVLWVFFLPLAATALHMVFASRIMARMLRSFMLYDWNLVLCCIAGTLLVFALLYFGIYRLTSHTYYRIVKR